jgi:hypothetical protein
VIRHRRQRHPARVREGQGDKQGAEDPDRGIVRLGDKDIDKMVKDAEAHAQDKSGGM